LKEGKLLVIGDNCFDITVKGSLEFKEDRNFLPKEYRTTPAGTGINFATAFSAFYGNAYYFTPLANDSFGMEIKNYLLKYNVRYIGKYSDKKTALIIAMINEIGERTTLALFNNASYTDISTKEFERIADNFDYLYISCGLCTTQQVQRKVLKIAEKAKETGMKLFSDPQIRIGKEVPGFIDTAVNLSYMSDIVFANKSELELMNLPQDMFIVEKKGNSGATVFYNSKKFSVKGVKVDTVDTTGAGDIFNAAFLSKFLDGKPITEALKFANYAAAFSVTKEGVYIPGKTKLRNFIKAL
jgi:sugar/nucleoside kinase (ribokinase family)